MSANIKGMEMPKNCYYDCPFEEDGWCCAVDGIHRVVSKDRPDWCPLEEAEPIHHNPEDAYREDFGKESGIADSNYERVTKVVNAVANGYETGVERERAELSLLATIAQILAAIVDELHELNERNKRDE